MKAGGGGLVGRWKVKGYRIQVILQEKIDLEVKQTARAEAQTPLAESKTKALPPHPSFTPNPQQPQQTSAAQPNPSTPTTKHLPN